ncbi:MAG: hypothetical protein Rubg2KO_22510 [Rubricoccaceae bacterium]
MPQFSEEEAQRVFARAAERQHAATDSPEGFSLDELKEIGKAAGLSPEHIAAAVSDVRFGSPTQNAPTTVMGAQTDVHRSRVVRGELTDEIWEGMVSRLRRTFKTKGVTADVGRSREWTGTNSTGGLSNLHVTAVPVENGTRITLETSKTDEAQQMKWIPGVFAVLTLFFPMIGALKDKATEPAILVFSTLMILMGLLAFFGTRRGYQNWSERRRNEFEALLDQFELMTLNEATPSPDIVSSTPAVQDSILGDALNELAEGTDSDSAASAQRLRS